MLCAKFLRPESERKHGRIYRATERAFAGMLHLYETCLRWVLRHQPLTLGVTLATAALSVYLYFIVPKGFFPQQDTGRMGGAVQAAQDISFEALRAKMQQFVEIVMKDPAVDTAVGFAGGGGTANTGRMFVTLKPLSERKISADQVIARLRGKLSVVPGATLFLQSSQDLTIGGRQGNAQFQYTIQADDLNDLNHWSPLVLQKLRSIPQLKDVNTDQQNRGLETYVEIDRATAGRLGVAPDAIDNALYDAFGQRQVSTMYRQLNQYHVVMEVDPKQQRSVDALQGTYVRSSNGGMVPLAAMVHFAPSNTPLAVNHQGQVPSVTMSFNLAPGVALGDATALVEGAMRSIGVPASVRGSFQGTAAAFQDSLSTQGILILAALLTVYIVLGVLYESYIHPITILSTLPSAGVGALLALLITHNDLNVIALIGILLLIGIVKKNAIMMIDFALHVERTEGRNSTEAIYEACVMRFRPIMMTTMAALIGGLPLALGTGVGSELRRPLGITIVGGLILSQMLTLFTTPVVYVYLDRLGLWVSRWRSERAGRKGVPAVQPGSRLAN
jgi:multidrug efflux pump